MRRAVVAAGAAVAVAAGGATAAALHGENAPAPAAAPSGPTAEITRSDLVDTKTVDGTLGYSGRRAVPNAATGTVTRTRSEGAVVRRGGWLYQVDGRPVVLMYGSIPVYRTLSQGVEGADVRQLERNLKALGHDPGTVDDEFSWRTAQAVREWQDDQGLQVTGAVDARQVVVASGPVRIADVTAGKGDRAGMSVVTTTSTRRIVHVDLAASDQGLARLGVKATVETPTGRRVRGRITSVGTAARPASTDGGEATIDLEITVNGGTGRLDQAPVSVELASERRAHVLSVPVEALLALREGGYGLRIVDGARSRVVAVETGLFASGRVEVSGSGLAEGMKVEVPTS
ncbi:peptidoglycan-binding protein [Microbispora sp. ATCC PTA-5024]|uniref:peptidoglycan-binding protein n=1 Tax=Microbispora sp. ATCC PTA-5024 TaxID=316330 RepID=UPI0003DCBD75|nr:peptidoglycan-binding protein [Microbispora sp. ATCC PTA-5024]ETK32212.1 hypothetical protein MPTA5024_30785 [Microbispora sp. ATCC PTA-5024]